MYAKPMLVASPMEQYAEVTDWAERRAVFVEAVWHPEIGAKVLDTATGRRGTLQAVEGPRSAWLRPFPGGGREWTTHVDALGPVPVTVS